MHPPCPAVGNGGRWCLGRRFAQQNPWISKSQSRPGKAEAQFTFLGLFHFIFPHKRCSGSFLVHLSSLFKFSPRSGSGLSMGPTEAPTWLQVSRVGTRAARPGGVPAAVLRPLARGVGDAGKATSVVASTHPPTAPDPGTVVGSRPHTPVLALSCWSLLKL